MAVTLSKVSVSPFLKASDADKIKPRVHLGDNVTSSLVDPAFAKYRDRELSEAESAHLKKWKTQLDLSKSTIEQHVEKRVSHLFLQATVCYRSGYVFEEGHTLHQGFGAKPLEDMTQQAAHSPTLPNIYATSPKTGQKFVYLYRSQAYDEANATIDVIKPVNDADRAIDEKYKDSLLRTKTVELLNRASRGELTPAQVAKKFARKLVGEIQNALNGRSPAEVKDVLKIYLKRAQELIDYTKDPNSIDRWLNLQLDNPLLTQVTEVIEQIEQSEEVSPEQIRQLIKRKIDEVPAIIYRQEHQERNNSRAPCHFYDLFYLRLLSQFKGQDLKELEKALDVNFEALKKKVASFSYTKATGRILNQNKGRLQQLVKELHPFLAALKKEESTEELVGLSPQKKVSLRPGIYRLRYEMILADQEAQSRIKSKIESVLNQLKGARTPTHLPLFFHRALFQHGQVDESLKTSFCKLLNVSSVDVEEKTFELKVNEKAHGALEEYAREVGYVAIAIRKSDCDQAQLQDFKDRIDVIYTLLRSAKSVDLGELKMLFHKRLFARMETVAQKRFVATLLGFKEAELDRKIAPLLSKKAAETVLEKRSAKIQEIVTMALKEMKELNEKTLEFRRNLLKELRLSHGMSQPHLKGIYTKMFPRFPMSAGTLCNLEKHPEIKKVEGAVVEHFSEIFGVSETLFYPEHFAE